MNRFKPYRTKIDEYYDIIPNGRCKPCEYGRVVVATGQFMFLGCYCEPYRGKWVAEIKNCPIGRKGEEKRCDMKTRGLY